MDTIVHTFKYITIAAIVGLALLHADKVSKLINALMAIITRMFGVASGARA